jgi:hypothetical protein
MSFYNKEVASRFLNDPKTMTLDSGRGRLYTIGTTSPSQPRNTKAALGRSSSGGTPAGAIVDGGLELFINIDGFTDPLADDDDAPPPAAGVAALAATAARAAAAATAAGVARRQLKIKAHQTIWIGCAFATDARAAKQARDSARSMPLRPRSSAGAKYYIVTHINKDIEPYCNSYRNY